MAEFIGTVADVAAGRVQIGYAIFHALAGESTIHSEARLLEHPIDDFQLKVQPMGNNTVQVTVVDLAAGIVHTNRKAGLARRLGIDPQGIDQRISSEVICLARQLKPGAVLRVT